MQFLEFEAYVAVDGKELPEYDIKVDDSIKTATCWIPSEAGKSFIIKWRARERHSFDLSHVAHADGVPIGGTIRAKHIGPQDFTTQAGFLASSTTQRRLMFASIELTDDDTYLRNSNKLNSLGEIVVCITRVEITGKATPMTEPLSAIDEKLHEKSKKAMTHRVKFGEEFEEGHSTHVASVKDICTLATFIFRYRSIDALRADGIAPPKPKIHNSGGKRKASDEGGEEGGELEDVGSDEQDEAELKVLMARVSKIQSKLAKKGSNGSKAPAAKKVKKEPVFLSGEVIDLT